jgi:acetyl-CoA synthetase
MRGDLDRFLKTREFIFNDLKGRVAPFRRVRRLEFVPDLPKTVSGKIRRVQLRAQEANREVKGPFEFTEEDVKS